MAYIISPDEVKKTLTGYKPEAAEDFHTASAKQADQLYAQALKTRPEATVILMSGGAASGKSEYVSTYLVTEPVIVFDGTLPTLRGATIKIQRTQRAKKQVEIHAVLPENLADAFNAFLNRDRKFAVTHFYRTHSSARQTLLEIAKTMPNILLKLYASSVQFVDKKPMITFKQLKFSTAKARIEFLESNQYTEEAIRTMVFHP